MTEEQKNQAFLEKRAQWQGKSGPKAIVDADQREIEEDKNDAKEDDEPIKFTPLGSEACPINPDDEDIEYSMSYRIPKIENLDKCVNLQRLGLRKNLIKKIEGLDNNHKLEELELYDNRIVHIENINHLVNLVYLDLSFNRLKEIQGIDQLVNVRKLYLSSNRIRKIENLENLTNLECLDVGDNKIR